MSCGKKRLLCAHVCLHKWVYVHLRMYQGAKSVADRWEEEFSTQETPQTDSEIWDRLQQQWLDADR